MGKISILTKEQQIILGELRQDDFLRNNFYFTGGTALSQFYLQHRFSQDLDFFTTEHFDNQVVFTLMQEWATKHGFTVQSRSAGPVYFFNLSFKNGLALKVDFAYYPYKQLAQPKVYDQIAVDSLLDIATNKLLTINQRSDVKDFVDLYYLFKEFTIWDLIPCVGKKFRMELDPLLVGADMLKVEDFEYLPKMIKPLNINTFKSFYRKRAKELGKSVVK